LTGSDRFGDARRSRTTLPPDTGVAMVSVVMREAVGATTRGSVFCHEPDLFGDDSDYRGLCSI
jgi:hypothetical protein